MNILFIRVIEVGCQCREVGGLFMGWLKPEWMPLADPDDLETDTTPLSLALLRDLVGPVFLMVAVL